MGMSFSKENTEELLLLFVFTMVLGVTVGLSTSKSLSVTDSSWVLDVNEKYSLLDCYDVREVVFVKGCVA